MLNGYIRRGASLYQHVLLLDRLLHAITPLPHAPRLLIILIARGQYEGVVLELHDLRVPKVYF